MKYIDKEKTVYDVLDLSDPHLKELIDYVCSHFYGAAYAKVSSDGQLLGFDIDGKLYRIDDPEFVSKIAIKLYEIEKTMQNFEQLYQESSKLPDHFSEDHIINHPRWIYTRRQYQFLGDPEKRKDEYLCPIKGIKKTIAFWLRLTLLANGNALSLPKGIDLGKEITHDEFEEIYPTIAFNNDKKYISQLVLVFMEFYKKYYGDKTDFSVLELMVNQMLAMKNPDDEFDKIKADIYNCISELDDVVRYTSQVEIDKFFYHPDLTLFTELANLKERQKSSVVLGKDRFPRIIYGDRTYDFRSNEEKNMYLSISKSIKPKKKKLTPPKQEVQSKTSEEQKRKPKKTRPRKKK